MIHLLQHCRQNFWYLVEQQMVAPDASIRVWVVSVTMDTDSWLCVDSMVALLLIFIKGIVGEDGSIRAELEQYSN